ncbi:MAG: scavenger receptor cysteine-rich domain-containing protein, partial [Solirubrobacterales bacterium]|nr:scavenger receptor cysteine-rich domain-containing protein [Solirubrobacterales bacterium]
PIWLDDVQCVGDEASLASCPASPWGQHNCVHGEDAGVLQRADGGADARARDLQALGEVALGGQPVALAQDAAADELQQLQPDVVDDAPRPHRVQHVEDVGVHARHLA